MYCLPQSQRLSVWDQDCHVVLAVLQERIRMSGRVTPIEAHSPIKIIELLRNSGLCLHTAAQYKLLFLVLAVISNWFQILRSYTLLLKPLVHMRSWYCYAGSL